MLLVPPNAKNMATGAIRPPIIVDLPEFAPVFPTTALFKGAFMSQMLWASFFGTRHRAFAVKGWPL